MNAKIDCSIQKADLYIKLQTWYSEVQNCICFWFVEFKIQIHIRTCTRNYLLI